MANTYSQRVILLESVDKKGNNKIRLKQKIIRLLNKRSDSYFSNRFK